MVKIVESRKKKLSLINYMEIFLGAIAPSDIVDEYPEVSGVTTAREAMKRMPEKDKAKIAEQVEVFRVEKRKFDIEVSKWDDNGNDIIVLAKHMCLIMMEMTDFTRGKGPLSTTMAVITAAKKISEAGTKLDKLARQIADQCPESSTKKDLLAYLQRIALYCHQLNITSRVNPLQLYNIKSQLIITLILSKKPNSKFAPNFNFERNCQNTILDGLTQAKTLKANKK